MIGKCIPKWPLGFKATVRPQSVGANGDAQGAHGPEYPGKNGVLPLDFTDDVEILGIHCHNVKGNNQDDISPFDFVKFKRIV